MLLLIFLYILFVPLALVSCLVRLQHCLRVVFTLLISSSLTYEREATTALLLLWLWCVRRKNIAYSFFGVLKIKVENLLSFNENFNSLKQLMPSAVFDDIVRVSHGGLIFLSGLLCAVPPIQLNIIQLETKNHLKTYSRRKKREV